MTRHNAQKRWKRKYIQVRPKKGRKGNWGNKQEENKIKKKLWNFMSKFTNKVDSFIDKTHYFKNKQFFKVYILL